MQETLTQRIARHEGFRSMPYIDTRGNWTVGYGHKLSLTDAKSTYPTGITQEQALVLLSADIDTATRLANGALPWLHLIDEVRQGIIVEMVYQLGIQGMLGFKNMLQAMQSDDWSAASDAMLDSEWHIQTPERCEELAALMISDDLPIDTSTSM